MKGKNEDHLIESHEEESWRKVMIESHDRESWRENMKTIW